MIDFTQLAVTKRHASVQNPSGSGARDLLWCTELLNCCAAAGRMNIQQRMWPFVVSSNRFSAGRNIHASLLACREPGILNTRAILFRDVGSLPSRSFEPTT